MRASRGIADARRVVTDDQDDNVVFGLEVCEPVEHVGEPEVDVRGRGVDPELDAERPAEGDLPLQTAFGKHVDRVTNELGDAHGAPTVDARPKIDGKPWQTSTVTIAALCSGGDAHRWRGNAGGGSASSACSRFSSSCSSSARRPS